MDDAPPGRLLGNSAPPDRSRCGDGRPDHRYLSLLRPQTFRGAPARQLGPAAGRRCRAAGIDSPALTLPQARDRRQRRDGLDGFRHRNVLLQPRLPSDRGLQHPGAERLHRSHVRAGRRPPGSAPQLGERRPGRARDRRAAADRRHSQREDRPRSAGRSQRERAALDRGFRGSHRDQPRDRLGQQLRLVADRGRREPRSGGGHPTRSSDRRSRSRPAGLRPAPSGDLRDRADRRVPDGRRRQPNHGVAAPGGGADRLGRSHPRRGPRVGGRARRSGPFLRGNVRVAACHGGSGGRCGGARRRRGGRDRQGGPERRIDDGGPGRRASSGPAGRWRRSTERFPGSRTRRSS